MGGEGKVGAGKAGTVPVMDNDGAVAEEGVAGGHVGEVGIHIAGATVDCKLVHPWGIVGWETHVARYRPVVIFPCLPARSPTWHCCGVLGSHVGSVPCS